MAELHGAWSQMLESPLFHIVLTLLAYQVGSWIYQRSNQNPVCNPVLVAIAIVIAVLTLSGVTYEAYSQGAKLISFLLGPATVALAIPLYRQFVNIRHSALAILIGLLAGSITAVSTAVGVAWILGADRISLISLSPKSVTAPVGIAIVEQLGGLPSLTAVLAIVTGIFGAMFGPVLLDLLGIRNWAARGFALGVSSHGIGTARALQVNKTAGAFAGLGMALNAVLTSALLPIAWKIFG